MPSSLPEPSPTPVTMPPLQFGGMYDPLATQCTRVELIADVPEPDPTKDYDRFSIVRLFAQGGQGHVFVARDEQLRREVALKELQPRFADRPLSRARFVREAEITGALEHPGVVPVYALGHHEGGRPYYAMRLIQGRNLQEVIQEYHDSKNTLSPADRNLKFRQMLQRFVSVCQTIAYAHSRCIVHRDIKPSNVLIGSYGEAVVVDWGLARPFHPTAGCANEPEANMPAGSSGSGSMSGVSSNDSTLMGTALGTPAFMSPEQAEGRWDLVGPAADIYSLGTTLYVLVAGKMPIEFGDWPSMAAKIRAGQITPACVANPSVPKALEAICKRAMALKPADRYASALTLAADVEHWLADEPVAAWQEPWSVRAARWRRRHEALVASMAALVMTAIIGLSIGFVVFEQERLARLGERKGRLDALNRTVSTMVGTTFGQQKGLTRQQREYLTNAVKQYEQFAAEMPSDLAGQLAAVAAYRQVGEIQKHLGMPKEAEAPLAQALERCKQLLAKRSGDLDVRRELARIETALGAVDRSQQGRASKAAEHLNEAVSIRRDIAKARPSDIDARRDLAAGLANFAAAQGDVAAQAQGDHEKLTEAVAAFREALNIRESIAKETNDSDDSYELAVVLNNLGKAISSCRVGATSEERGRLGAESELLHDRARQIAATLVAKDAEEGRFREVFAVSLRNVAAAVRCREVPDEISGEARSAAAAHNLSQAKKLFEESAVQYEQLSKDNPNVPEYGLEAGGIRCMLGKIHLSRRESTEALREFDHVISRIGEGESDDVRRMTMLRAALAGRQEALTNLKRFKEAGEACTKLVQFDPERADMWRSILALCLLRDSQRDAAFAEIASLVSNPKCANEAVYNCACVYALASTLDPQHAEEFARQSVKLLELTAQRGYFNDKRGKHLIKDMDADSDLQPLRNREDYKKFRASLERPAVK